jgi:transcriptional regulator with XRE-family HTH domain
LPLGEYLQDVRKKRNLTQREVSQALRYSSAQFISNFERGIVMPPLTKMKILIDLYGLRVETVMDLILKCTREVLLEALTSKVA